MTTNKITQASVLAIIGFVAGALVAWGAHTTRLSAMEVTTADHEGRIRIIERVLTEFMGRIDERLSNIERMIE